MPRAEKPNVMGRATRTQNPDLSTAYRQDDTTPIPQPAPDVADPPVKTTILIPEHLHRRLRRFKTEDRVPIATAIVYALEQTYPSDELPEDVPRKGRRP